MINFVLRSCLIGLVFAPFDAVACSTAPMRSTVDLVQESSGIYLGQLVGVKQENGNGTAALTFEIHESLKGPEMIILTREYSVGNSVAAPSVRDSQHSFETYSFWEEKSGASVLGTDCVWYPQVEVGRNYLLFEGVSDPRATEPIDSEEDLWLSAVRAALEGEQLPSISLLQYFKGLDLIYLGECGRRDGVRAFWVSEVLWGGAELKTEERPLFIYGDRCPISNGRYLGIWAGYGPRMATAIRPNGTLSAKLFRHELLPELSELHIQDVLRLVGTDGRR